MLCRENFEFFNRIGWELPLDGFRTNGSNGPEVSFFLEFFRSRVAEQNVGALLLVRAPNNLLFPAAATWLEVNVQLTAWQRPLSPPRQPWQRHRHERDNHQPRWNPRQPIRLWLHAVRRFR